MTARSHSRQRQRRKRREAEVLRRAAARRGEVPRPVRDDAEERDDAYPTPRRSSDR